MVMTKHLSIQNQMALTFQSFLNALVWMDLMPVVEKFNADKLVDLQQQETGLHKSKEMEAKKKLKVQTMQNWLLVHHNFQNVLVWTVIERVLVQTVDKLVDTMDLGQLPTMCNLRDKD